MLTLKKTKGNVIASASTVYGDIKASGYIRLFAGARVNGSLYAKGDDQFSSAAVSHSASRVDGSVYANGNLHLWGFGSIQGDAYLTGKVKGAGNVRGLLKVLQGERHQHLSQSDLLAANTVEGFDKDEFKTSIYEKTSFAIKVDVRAYKDEANYIFTKQNKFDRVFLNKLTNKANKYTYLYKNGKQYRMDDDGNEELLSDNGFALGDYKINSATYTGAICLNVDGNNLCQDDIVGYLPRISVGRTLGIKDDYGYGSVLDRWRVRSIKNSSEIENVVLAPGIIYFEGKLEFAGSENIQADSKSNDFTNSFLAEGKIWNIAFSPRIYSPFNVLRESDDYVPLICNRQLRDTDDLLFDAVNRIPSTLSNTYLIPNNLCDSDTEFNRSMDKDFEGNKQQVIIDDTPVDKL